MDEVDIMILAELLENSRISVTELSRKINLSRPSLAERMERLRENQYILGYTIDINPKLMNLLSFYIQISGLKIEFEKFEERVKNFDEITECYSLTGSRSYLLKGYAVDVSHLNRILEQLVRYSTAETSIVLAPIFTKKLNVKKIYKQYLASKQIDNR